MGPQFLKELPDYLSAAKDFTVDHKDVQVFTKSVLSWWASHGSKFPAWAEAARIVFSFTPNSAAAERVFSLLKIFFTDVRDLALADITQATLMLRYNKRKTGHAQ
eukprot:4300415-Prymnesium_polylepis.1